MGTEKAADTAAHSAWPLAGAQPQDCWVSWEERIPEDHAQLLTVDKIAD